MSREKMLENQLESMEWIQRVEHRERLDLFMLILSMITNGEWDEIKVLNPGLHGFVSQATKGK